VSVRRYLLLCGVLALVGLAGCQNMQIQPKLAEPYDSSPLFGSAAREILPEAVPVGFLNDDELLTNGTVNGELATEFPFPITREILDRGQNQFNAFCAPCHGYSGYGDGVVVEEGFQPAQSFHTEEFRAVPVGRIYQAIAYGSGAMFDYAARVNVEDRWAIVAYIRALQLSQNAAYDDLPTELQSQIDLAGN
jgi:mono/diheme cytochrome c family protein